MIHLNEELKESGLGFVNFILPECYACTTIGDFLRNKEILVPTKKLFPPAVFHYGDSLISFPSVYFKFKEEKSKLGYISDLSHTLEVGITRKIRGELEEGKRLSNPIIAFRHNPYGNTYLISFSENTSKKREKRFNLQKILEDVRGLSPA